MSFPNGADAAKKPGDFQPGPKHGPGKPILPPPPELPWSPEKQKEYGTLLITALEKQFGVSLRADDGLELPPLNMDAINEKTERYDCVHPHVRGCWGLLQRSLNSSYQAMEGTTPKKVDEGIKKWSLLEESLATPEFLAIKRTVEDAISDWAAAHPENRPEHKQKLVAGLTNPAFDKAASHTYSNEFARVQNLTYVMAQEIGAKFEQNKDDSAALAQALTDLLDQFASSLSNPQNKPSVPITGSDLNLRDLLPGLAIQPKDPPLQRQKKATAELITIIDMALGAGDTELFREAMGALKDVNPSAYQAILCLKGTSAAIFAASQLANQFAGKNAPAEAKKDPTAPTVSQMLQGVRPRENVKGALTGTVYFEKAPPSEAANTVAISGAIILAAVILTVANKAAEDVYGAGTKELKNYAEKQATDLVEDRGKSLDKAKEELNAAEEGGDEVQTAVKKNEVNDLEKKLEDAKDLKDKIDKGDKSSAVAIVQVYLMKKADSTDEAHDEAIKEMGEWKQPKVPTTGAGGGQGESASPTEPGQVRKADSDNKPDLPAFTVPTTGAGGKYGETPDLYPPSGPTPSDAMSWLELMRKGPSFKGEMLTIFDHPEYREYARSVVSYAIDRLIDSREKQLRQVKYDETKWQDTLEDETRVIDLNDPRVSELPGEVRGLDDCFAADPTQEAAERPPLG